MVQLVQSQEENVLASFHFFSPTVADFISGDPKLERHSAKLRVGQLEGSSRCSADLCSP